MFERYTEKARRVIFFARYEASQFGSPYIETEHLLLGLLREDKALTNRFLRSHASVESIRKQIEAHTTIREKVSTSVDLPLSNECKRVLAYAAEEAERLGHRAGLVGRSVVKDEGLRFALVVLDETQHGGPRIAEQFDRLAADGQVDIHVRIGLRVPGREEGLMGGQVEPGAREIDRQADGLADEVGSGEEQERREHQVLGLEPDLAEDEAT